MIWFPLSKGFTKEARIKLQAFFCILLKNWLYLWERQRAQGHHWWYEGFLFVIFYYFLLRVAQGQKYWTFLRVTPQQFIFFLYRFTFFMGFGRWWCVWGVNHRLCLRWGRWIWLKEDYFVFLFEIFIGGFIGKGLLCFIVAFLWISAVFWDRFPRIRKRYWEGSVRRCDSCWCYYGDYFLEWVDRW